MAFQNVNNKSGGGKATSEAVKLTGLEVGGSVTGYVLSFVPSLQNPDNQNIFMRSEDGEHTFYVYTAGNMKYLINDGKIEKGLLTKIVRLEDKMVKGKKSSQFEVLQDSERSVEDLTWNSLGTSESASTTAPAAVTTSAANIKAATERASVKAQAAKLTQQATAKR